MAKIAKSPLAAFMQDSLKMARRRDAIKGWISDDSVTVGYLMGLYHAQQGKCYWSNEEMTMERGLNDEKRVTWSLCTIDRIDNTLGYIVGNLRFACDGVNRMRGNMSDARFAALCKRIGMRG